MFRTARISQELEQLLQEEDQRFLERRREERRAWVRQNARALDQFIRLWVSIRPTAFYGYYWRCRCGEEICAGSRSLAENLTYLLYHASEHGMDTKFARKAGEKHGLNPEFISFISWWLHHSTWRECQERGEPYAGKVYDNYYGFRTDHIVREVKK